MPKTSAIFGLPDDKEVVVEIKADHGDICRFDMTDATDRENFKRVWRVLEDMYELTIRQGESEGVLTSNAAISQQLRSLPATPQDTPSNLAQ